MDLSTIDWAATTKLVVAVLAVLVPLFTVGWQIHKNNKSSQVRGNTNVTGNNNTTNVAGRDIRNDRK